jgi:hypothetical protein
MAKKQLPDDFKDFIQSLNSNEVILFNKNISNKNFAPLRENFLILHATPDNKPWR